MRVKRTGLRREHQVKVVDGTEDQRWIILRIHTKPKSGVQVQVPSNIALTGREISSREDLDYFVGTFVLGEMVADRPVRTFSVGYFVS